MPVYPAMVLFCDDVECRSSCIAGAGDGALVDWDKGAKGVFSRDGWTFTVPVEAVDAETTAEGAETEAESNEPEVLCPNHARAVLPLSTNKVRNARAV